VFGGFGLFIGVAELLGALVMLVFAIAFGIQHPVAAALGSLFIFVGVVLPIWCTVKKSGRKVIRW
jgi:hypothetical protein